MLRMPVARNLVMSILRALSPFGVMSAAREAPVVRGALRQFDIRPPRGELPVGNLSGGNQQKVVLAKEILGGRDLLLLDEPTRGVDVGAKGEIYRQLRTLAEQGLGVLVASSELPELVGLCDRSWSCAQAAASPNLPATSTNTRCCGKPPAATWGTAA